MITDEWKYEIDHNPDLIAFGWAFFWVVWYDPNVHGFPSAISEIPELLWIFLLEEELIEKRDGKLGLDWSCLLSYRDHFRTEPQ